MEEYYTYFLNEIGEGMASLPGIVPIVIGTQVIIHGYTGKAFIVKDILFKVDQPDNKPGLHITLKEL